ncbi:MAG TPA: hypothetical protein VMM78_17950 [Thermomicrobiales bacterium]|nr:hypothetical protein [Thermomicrobiales bacterium]
MRTVQHAAFASLIAVLTLAGCGGDGPSATSLPQLTTTATPTTADESPTATVVATATTAPEPTATSTPAPTNTPRPIATQAPTATATVAPTATPDPLAERADMLLLALLDERSLPQGWTLDNTETRFEADPEQQIVCDLHEFPGRAELVMEVEAEFTSADGMQLFQQTIAEYPMATAFQALNFVRSQISECPEWQSPDGITFQVEPVLMYLPTSMSLAYTIRFELNGQQFEGRWIFVNTYAFVVTIAYFAPEGTDLTVLEAAVFDVVPRLQVVSNSFDEPDYYDDLELAVLTSMQLMSRAETLQLSEQWFEAGVAIPEGEQRYNVCGLDLFTERFESLEELQNEFVVDRNVGPFLWQSISTFPDADAATDAMEHIRDTVSCAEFLDNTGNTWQVLDYPELGVGDEAHAALVSIDDSVIGSAQGEFVFVRVGEQITVIVYVVVQETLDHGRVAGITEMAVREIERLRR